MRYNFHKKCNCPGRALRSCGAEAQGEGFGVFNEGFDDVPALISCGGNGAANDGEIFGPLL